MADADTAAETGETLSKEEWEARALNERRLGLLILENKAGPELANGATHLRNAAEAFEKAGWKDRRAECLVQLGKLQAKRKHHLEAADAYVEALRFFATGSDRTRACDAAKGAASNYGNANDLEPATRYAKQAVDIATELNDHLRIAETNQVLGRILIAQGEHDAAIAAVDKALKIFIDYRKGIEQAVCRELLGAAHHRQGDYAGAAEHYEAGIAKYEELARRFDAHHVLSRWAESETKAGRYDEALTLLERLERQHRDNNANEMVAQVLRLKATNFLKKKAIEESIDALQQADDICAGLDDATGRARCHYMLGSVFLELGDTDRAVDRYTDALGYAELQDNAKITERILAAVAKVQRQAGKKEEALATMHRWVKVLKQLGQRSEQLRVLGTMAKTHMDVGADDEAEAHFRRLLSVCQQPEDLGERLYAEHGLATILIKKGEPEEARPHLENAVEGYSTAARDRHSKIVPPLPLNHLHYQLGNLLMDLEAEEEALVHLEFARYNYDTAEQLSDEEQHHLARVMVALGNAHSRLGDGEQAKSLFQEAARLCEEQGDLRATMIIRRATER